jgi:hypothetical protein
MYPKRPILLVERLINKLLMVYPSPSYEPLNLVLELPMGVKPALLSQLLDEEASILAVWM